MKGDRLVPKPYQTNAARDLFVALNGRLRRSRKVIAIGGESGSGKTEIAYELARLLDEAQIPTFLFQQDDYFIRPPRTNREARERDISLVGPHEVRLDLLEEHLATFKVSNNGTTIDKPLVIFDENRISSETINPGQYHVAICEGTYANLLNNVDVRVFIARSYHDTLDDRRTRSRDPIDDFTEGVLEIEHKIIAKHRALADIIVDKDFSVRVVKKGTDQ